MLRSLAMGCWASLRRCTAARRPDALGSMRGLLSRHLSYAVCQPPAAVAQTAPRPHVLHSIRRLFFRRAPSVPPSPRWYHDPRMVAVATAPLIGFGVAVIADHGCQLETVPYTNRAHMVWRSPLEERAHTESHFADVKERIADSILDDDDPDTIRVNMITSRLVRALHHILISKIPHGSDAQTRHLDGLDWEVILVESNSVNVGCWPAGKIIVHTGLLDFFETDAEIATFIAHEIGHIVARHSSEKIIYKWLPSPLKVPFLRRTEAEADHIGIMLLGAAGFDPRIAPAALEKLATRDRYRTLLSKYPSNKKRSQLLSQPKLMQEALELYKEVSRGQDT